MQAQQLSTEPQLATAMVQLVVHLPDLEPDALPVRLRPGPPLSLRLCLGHPFREQAFPGFHAHNASAVALTSPLIPSSSRWYES